MTTRTKSRLMSVLVKQLLPLLEEMAQYDEVIVDLFLTHADSPIFSRLPRAGKRLAPGLWAEIGDERTRYKDAGSVQGLAGPSLVIFRSGPHTKAYCRSAWSTPLRDVLHQRIASRKTFSFLGSEGNPLKEQSMPVVSPQILLSEKPLPYNGPHGVVFRLSGLPSEMTGRLLSYSRRNGPRLTAARIACRSEGGIHSTHQCAPASASVWISACSCFQSFSFPCLLPPTT